MTSEQGLRIGFVPGVTLTKWRRIWSERYRTVLEAVDVAERQQRQVLTDGAVDMCFVRLPIDNSDLHIIPLYEEQPVLWLSKDHILSALDEITAEDIAEHGGTRVSYEATPESIELASYSAALLRVPLSIARSGSRKDMVHRPVLDAEPTTVGLAWLVDNEHPLIQDFIGVVRGRTANSTRTAQEKGQPAGPAPRRPAPSRRRGAPPSRRRHLR